MDHVVLTSHELNLSEISDLVADDGCGAISFFVGTTRDHFETKKVLSLEYEAYEPMAVKEIKKICHELRSRWIDIVNIAIYHRLGLVKVREASVIIAISSPHRQSALDATAQAIEELKCRVPIWKKEKYDDDEAAWKENKECTWRKTAEKHFQNLDIPCQSIHDTCDLKNLVQISAPESEMERRIQSFVKRKREQIDLNNAMDFMGLEYGAQAECNGRVTCARTDSVLFKQEHSKGHLRVQRARNTNGPQTRPDYLQALNKHMSTIKPIPNTPQINSSDSLKLEKNQINPYYSERLSNVEDFLRIRHGERKTMHERLKEIENRILSLEAISPEYKHFLDNPMKLPDPIKSTCIEKNYSNFVPKRKTYTIKQLDDIITYYEKKQTSKGNQSNFVS